MITPSAVRARFPALASDFAFLENAGGSPVPDAVIEATARHFAENYVQLGAGYPHADRATAMVADAHAFAEELVNAGPLGRVVLGPSTTALTTLLANAVGETLAPGDEVVVGLANHEANAGPWARLERRGVRVRWWPVDRETWRSETATLRALLTDRTKLVAMSHVSNLLGVVEDVRSCVDLAHAAGARVCLDSVAFAPHRAIDVGALGADWVVYSHYKVFGPHLATMFGTHAAWSSVEGPNHVFIPRDAVPARWELGGVSHEACAGLLGLRDYLAFLAQTPYAGRVTVETAFVRMAELEAAPFARLVQGLAERGAAFFGPGRADDGNVPTVSFQMPGRSADAVARWANASGTVGIRSGHMYAVRLLESLGVPPEPGVVRASLVHVNTVDEVERLLARLDGLP